MLCTLDLYTDYLISSTGQTSATSLSRLRSGAVSHDQVTRWLRPWLKVWSKSRICRQPRPGRVPESRL